MSQQIIFSSSYPCILFMSSEKFSLLSGNTPVRASWLVRISHHWQKQNSRCWLSLPYVPSWMRSSRLARSLERLVFNTKVVTVLGSIPASMKQCWKTYIQEKIPQNSPFKICLHDVFYGVTMYVYCINVIAFREEGEAYANACRLRSLLKLSERCFE